MKVIDCVQLIYLLSYVFLFYSKLQAQDYRVTYCDVSLSFSLHARNKQLHIVLSIIWLIFSLLVGTDLYEGQLLGEFEMDSKQLEKASWSEAVDSVFLMQQMKEVVKRQDVIYGEE